ncbi:oligosaccharide repeat unit polymerase [Devosia sp. BK]|uniref:O-antigen polymerase n=1 Tax=Devosia sp. BK TaxID=2871706 RepID=UPI00293B25D5|nr:O-antigen polymerase [Devosia sp. BK]MDV3253788.1 oligosaccharide repeat unit polymerase [Devosia sp. BK]
MDTKSTSLSSVTDYILTPGAIFALVWISVIVLSSVVQYFLPGFFYDYTLSFYIYVVGIIALWVILSGATYSVGRKIAWQLPRFGFMSGHIARILLVIIPIVFIGVSILEIHNSTGSFLPLPANIERHRYLITEMAQSPRYAWVAIMNGAMFLLPISAFIYFKDDRIFSAIQILFFIVFVYMSGARASFFMAMTVFAFFYLQRHFSLKFVLTMAILLVFSFGVLGAVVGKGSLNSYLVYLLGPAHAFSAVLNGDAELTSNMISFRVAQPVLSVLGIGGNIDHILPYVQTPSPVNVYTVFGVYFSDFGWIGSYLILSVFAALSGLICGLAKGSNWIPMQIWAAVCFSQICLGIFHDYYSSGTIVFAIPIYGLVLFGRSSDLRQNNHSSEPVLA